MTAHAERPFPQTVDPDYRDHIDALARGELAVRRCTTCDATQWPPRPTCAHCAGTSFATRRINPIAGHVHTFTIVRRAFHPWFADRLPYGVAVVDITGAALRMTGLYEGDPSQLACGLSVVGRGEQLGGAPALIWSPA